MPFDNITGVKWPTEIFAGGKGPSGNMTGVKQHTEIVKGS